jgi:DNA repair protein RadD
MYTLRPYQQEAVDSTLKYFRKRRSPAVIVLPTGAGKSLVIAELARVAVGRVLILAHVKELVAQNHSKYESYNLTAGIYSAGLERKDTDEKVIFGSIQSVARAEDNFFKNFSLLIIDECHRINEEGDTQYTSVVKRMKNHSRKLCILGLTATPYRMGLGWIYQYNHQGEVKTSKARFFSRCIFELSLKYMIEHKYLTPPVKVDLPVTCYDFSELVDKDSPYANVDIEHILKQQKRLTPLIIKNIIEIAVNYKRKGVMIFSSSIKHAQEIMRYLPEGDAHLIIGDTKDDERDSIIDEFKEQKFKYLVNVSVLTTGFDAPHVDIIAILRPTESVSLYQQIIGRGLRLDNNKKDCIILDYTGMSHDIYSPQIRGKKPNKQSVPVKVACPKCEFVNNFWGILSLDGEVAEHFGRKCTGAKHDPETLEFQPCGYRFRLKICHACGAENDITAKNCQTCTSTLIDADTKLKQAKLSKDTHILRPDSVELSQQEDKEGNEYLEVKYYDFDAQDLSEEHYLNDQIDITRFNINFLRAHLRRPELFEYFNGSQDVITHQALFRMPSYVIARKQGKKWRITEKIFGEELSRNTLF